MRVLVIGSGAVARAMSAAWADGGMVVSRRAARGEWPTGEGTFEAVLVAVRDHAIAAVAQRAVASGAAGAKSVLLHAAGALPPEEVFASVRDQVRGIALCHPLVAVAAPTPGQFRDAVFAVAGDAAGVPVALELARLAGGRPVELDPPALARYHAAAALAANHTLALAAAAIALLEDLGIARRDAELAVGGLLGSAAANVARLGLPTALTGPIARGDVAVVARHLAALSGPAARLYRSTGPAVVALARARGLASAEALEEILHRLEESARADGVDRD